MGHRHHRAPTFEGKVYCAVSLLSALTPVYNADAPLWIWPFALIACLLMAGQAIGAMRSKSQAGTR